MAKTREIKVLQQNWGYGWDDIITYEKDERGYYDHKQIKQDLRDYRENEPQAPVRLITRRVPNV